MHNYLLDRYPEDYKGYLIRTGFRIGVQIQLCVSDPDFSEEERTLTALSLLYGYGIPSDLQLALDGLIWFMNCGNPPSEEEPEEEEIFSFDFDSARIVSGVRKVYGIDLARADLHWFEFMAMLQELKNTAFADVLEIRRTKESEVDKKRLSEFRRMKKRFAIPRRISQQEQDAIDDFLSQVREAERKREA